MAELTRACRNSVKINKLLEWHKHILTGFTLEFISAQGVQSFWFQCTEIRSTCFTLVGRRQWMWEVVLKFSFQLSVSLGRLCVDYNCINNITRNYLLSLP